MFNLVMRLPLKVACSETAIVLGDAVATYLSAGFRLFRFDGGGNSVGGFWGRLARVVRLVVLGVLLLAAATP